VSSFYRTDPIGHADQPDFVNAVVKIAWRGSPERLLAAIQDIERTEGRVRRFRNGPREIDVDVLDFGGVVREAPDPVLPHPRMESRRFVLAPLAEIAPRWRHPVSGMTARQLMRRLPPKPGAVLLTPDC
jgi:2-amino-4-hydroxy-6-hydroxymethyldihydropteridine diphosphokinase